MNHIIAQFNDWSAADLWILGLICFIGVSLLTWAVTEVREQRKPVETGEAEVVTPIRPIGRPLTNRELLSMLNDDVLPRPAPAATVSSITGFRQSHTR